jgi:hypothetical protein
MRQYHILQAGTISTITVETLNPAVINSLNSDSSSHKITFSNTKYKSYGAYAGIAFYLILKYCVDG